MDELPSAWFTARLPDPGTRPKGRYSALCSVPLPGPACPRLAEGPAGRVRAPRDCGRPPPLCLFTGDCAAPCRLSPLGDRSWPPGQPLCWGPLSLPSEDRLSGLVPKALFKRCLCFFLLECRAASWFPRLGILRLGSGRRSTPPALCLQRSPGSGRPPRGSGWGVEVGRDPTPGPWPEPRAALALDLALPPVRPRAMRQESQAGPAGSVSPARTLQGGAAFPGSSLPGR